jgi:hypothetical protein
VPVTLYVSTYYVFDRRPVFDGACQYLFWKAWNGANGGLRDPVGDGGRPLRTLADYAQAAADVVNIASQQRWSADQKHEWLRHIALRFGLDWQGFLQRRLVALMHPDEIAALDPTIVDVQLHTHRHRVPEEKALFVREIVENRRALGECGLDTGRRTHFCYPSGVYRPAFLPWLAEAGITSAVTTDPGLASRRHPPLLLPRFVDTGTTSAVEFEGWTSGLRQVLGRSRLALAR